MTILLVDDDPDETILFNEALEEIDSNIKLVTISDGDQCLDILKNVTPDFIFLDINMPRMGGKDCVKALRKSETLKHIPVVMYTTSISPSDEEFFKEFNVPFIKKPPVFKELVDFVRKAIY